MSTHPVKSLAASAARTVGRRLRARRGRMAVPARVRDHAGPGEPRAEVEPRVVPLPQAAAPAADEEPRADSAELDALRGALVHELDRLAGEDDCSASFRRAG